MTPESNPAQHEIMNRKHTAPPAVESLVLPDPSQESWLEDISTNKSFQEQVKERRDIITNIDTVFSCLPRADMSLEDAVKENILSEEQVSDLYISLSNLIGNDDYKRALLYIPFEYLPNKDWNPESDTLKKSIDQFRSTYISAWNSLLHIHDVRANFVDGDVLEAESRVGDFPRVVKAAHLIPKLVQVGMIETEDVLSIMNVTEDEVLKQSILDSLFVLADLGLIDDESRTHLHSLDNKDNITTADTHESEAFDTKTLEELTDTLNSIEKEEYTGVTKNRTKWLRQEKKRRLIESFARKITTEVIGGSLSNELIQKLSSPDASTPQKETLILGIQNGIESIASTDIIEAKKLYAAHQNTLITIWNQNIPEIQDTLSTTFYHFHGLHIIDDEQLGSLGLSIPALAGPFSKNLNGMSEEINIVQNLVDSIESDYELSRFVYPVIIMSGSRLKGYAKSNADIDISIFIKPGTPFTERTSIQQIIKSKCTHEKIQGEIVEFWLDETESGMVIHNFDNTDPLLGESFMTHNIFGGVWEGNKQTIEEIRGKLLPRYCNDSEEILHGRRARGLYIEELERDSLQYRLLHKGYARFFAPIGGIHTEHSSHIDSASMFWDSGYRQTALKLYANRVFLPSIPEEKNK